MLYDGRKLAERLIDFIYLSGKTAIDISMWTGIPLSTIYAIMRGDCFPDLKTVIAIADFFCCSVDFLLGFQPVWIKKRYKKAVPFSVNYPLVLYRYGFTKNRIQRETGIPVEVQTDWQHGLREPSIETVLQLAVYIKIPIDELLGRA